MLARRVAARAFSAAALLGVSWTSDLSKISIGDPGKVAVVAGSAVRDEFTCVKGGDIILNMPKLIYPYLDEKPMKKGKSSLEVS